MTMLRAALWYAARGWAVFPLLLGGKEPMGKLVRNGVAHATTDTEVLTYWWHKEPDANIGIACRDVLVVDPDPRNGGDISLAALFAQHGEFPTTPTVRTGGGGEHFMFRRPAATLLAKLAPGVDLIHGAKRYIVAAPSIHPNRNKYEWTTPPTVALADPPAWLIDLARRRIAPAAPVTDVNVTSEEREKRATLYVSHCAPAIAGQGGHVATFNVCGRVARGFALSESEALRVLSPWNEACEPPWSEPELRRKIKQALVSTHTDAMPFGKLLETKKKSAA